MRLYIRTKNKNKIYLKIKARTRSELRQLIGRDYFIIKGNRYKISDVIAEKSTNSTATGAVLGGLIGLLGGPIGVAIGSAAGGFIGNNDDDKESRLVNKFNKSRNLWLRNGK